MLLPPTVEPKEVVHDTLLVPLVDVRLALPLSKILFAVVLQALVVMLRTVVLEARQVTQNEQQVYRQDGSVVQRQQHRSDQKIHQQAQAARQ